MSFLCARSYSQVNLELTPLDATHYNLALDFDIDEYDGIYEQYLSITIDDPDIVLSKLDCSLESTIQYSPAFKSSKSLFLGPCSFSGTIEAPSANHLETAHVYVTYRLLSQKHSETIALPIKEVLPAHATLEIQNSIEIPQIATQIPIKNDPLPTFIDNESTITTPEQTAPPLIPLVIMSIFCALVGIFLIFKGSYTKRKRWRPIAASMGMALIACSIVVAAKTYQSLYTKNQERLISIKK